MNNDGRDDLVHLVDADHVYTWISNGDGTFTLQTFQPWSGYDVQRGSWLTADVTGDGQGDLVHLVNAGYVHTWISTLF